ncbi:NTP transferase domain-containing protein [Gordonia sp. CPCC 205515]|uniref:nucleotidyltransferase family protein n=1 Tax=Gordonia sp. CPCC 205515 TaxID=3140791 RepID=UPI003AF3F9F4
MDATDGQTRDRSERGPATVGGVVLAAGAGSRYGEPKIGAHQGEWLRLAVAALAAGGCEDVVVAMGARVVEPPPGASTLSVPDWSVGLSATVRRALDAASERGWAAMVLHVVDTPDVGPEVVARLLATTGADRAALARAVYDGGPGHPVYLGADHFDAVGATLSGDTGAGRYLAAHTDVVVGVECGDLATGVDHDQREA